MVLDAAVQREIKQIALIEAGSPGLNIYSHVAMGRGLALLATTVRDAGYTVKAFVEDISGKESIDWDYIKHSQVVGFSAITCTLPRTADLIRETRKTNPSAIIVLGGPEPSCKPERSLQLDVDFIVRGEGERSFLELLQALQGNKQLLEVKGISWLQDGEVKHNKAALQLLKEEIDAISPADYSLVHMAEKRTVGSVWRSRGCPQRCDFCEVWHIWPRYVVRDDDISVQEMMSAQEDGHQVVFLIDDNAAGNKSSFKRFLRKTIDAGFIRHLVVQLRADAVCNKDGSIDRELLRLLRNVSSSTIVCVGVESADNMNLSQMNKRTDAKAMQRAIKAMRRYGLLVHGMIIALAGDSAEIIRKNGDFAVKYLSTLQYLFEVPLPGTVRARRHEDDGRILFNEIDDLAYYDGMHVVLKPDYMEPLKMQDAVVKEYKRFYSSRRVLIALIKGLLLRFRALSPGQRRYLKQLEFKDRLHWWLRFHLEYKLVQWSILSIGRRRVRDFLRDPSYQEYRAKLESF